MRVRASVTARVRGHAAGYTLVAMVVIFTVMTIGVAAALPYWSKIVQRDKEEELIFRGLQYAEAIRLFQLRFGRYPIQLEELIEVKPRCIRQLWKDPMTKEGEWALILAQPGGRNRQGRAGGANPQNPGSQAPGQPGGQVGGLTPGVSSQDLSGASGLSQRGNRSNGQQTVGPIIGVHSKSDETGVKVFQGGNQYNQWKFRAELIPVAQVIPGTLVVPRVTSDWIGRPFPQDLEPAQGNAPTATGQPGGTSPNLPRTNRRQNQRLNRDGG